MYSRARVSEEREKREAKKAVLVPWRPLCLRVERKVFCGDDRKCG